MNIENIREYAKIMKENELTALEITEGEKVIRLERQIQVKEVVAAAPIAPMAPMAPMAMDAAKPAEAAAPAASNSNLTDVTSPMVGVFYAAPTENSEPFVKVGDKVSKGDVLCIVEAMKLMNEITAECDGTIAEVCLKNGDVVEFGTVLFRIER